VLAASLVPLTAAFAVSALLFVVGALVFRRRARVASQSLIRLSKNLDDRAAFMPIMLSTGRANLAERGAAIEHGIWMLSRFDTKLADTTRALAARRRGVDRLHERVIASRGAIERLKSALHLIMRAIELRRTILG
jgi:hypothetical protein